MLTLELVFMITIHVSSVKYIFILSVYVQFKFVVSFCGFRLAVPAPSTSSSLVTTASAPVTPFQTMQLPLQDLLVTPAADHDHEAKSVHTIAHVLVATGSRPSQATVRTELQL